VRRAIPLALALSPACGPAADCTPPPDTDPADADTDAGDSDTDVADSDAADTDAADTDAADTDTDTDAGDTDTDTPAACVQPATSANLDPRAVGAGDPSVAALAADLTAFAVRLHQVAPATPTEPNRVLSPWSLAGFLTVAYADVGGTALTALDDALAASAPWVDFAGALATWSADLQAPPARRHAVVQRASSVWHRVGSAPGPSWTARAPAGVSLQALSADPEDSRARINRWVEDRTACLIPELFPTNALSASTALVVVDAVALVSDWAAPFEPSFTGPGAFALASGGTVSTSFMAGDVHAAAVGAVGDLHVLRLPLADPGYAVYAAWTDAAGGLAAEEAALTGPALTALLDAPTPQASRVVFPKLSLRQRPDVAALLDGVGLAAVRLATPGDLCATCLPASLLVHEAVVVVDEQGVKAAAATGGVFNDTAGAPLPEVRVDRPFLWVLRDEVTGIPLFLGRVGDPTQP
jgi:serpin B